MTEHTGVPESYYDDDCTCKVKDTVGPTRTVHERDDCPIHPTDEPDTRAKPGPPRCESAPDEYSRCDRRAGHDGPHRDYFGKEWPTDEPEGLETWRDCSECGEMVRLTNGTTVTAQDEPNYCPHCGEPWESDFGETVEPPPTDEPVSREGEAIPDDVADRFLKAISAEKKTAVREGEDADAIDYYGDEPTLVHAVIRWWEERGRPTHADEPEGDEDNPFGASDEELESAFGGPRPEEGRSNRGRPDPTDEPVSREGEKFTLADEVRSVAKRARLSRMQEYVLNKAADRIEGGEENGNEKG